VTAGMLRPLAVTGLLLAFLFFYRLLWMEYPQVWPDEALFSSPAINLAMGRGMGTDLLENLIPGIESRTYWIPPLYPALLSGVFRMAGIGIAQVRVFSLVLGVLSILCFLGVARLLCQTGRNPVLAYLLGAMLLVSDRLFLRASILGRMEILVIALSLGALYAYLMLQRQHPGRARTGWCCALGLMTGLAFITHPMSLCVLGAIGIDGLLGLRDKKVNGRDIAVATSVAACCLLPWVWYAAQDLPNFSAQFLGQLARKAGNSPGSLIEFLGTRFYFIQYESATGIAAITHGVAFLGLLYLCWVRRQRAFGVRCVSILLCCTLFLVLWANEIWYPVYLVTVAALSLTIALQHCRRLQRWALAAVVVAYALGNWGSLLKMSREYGPSGGGERYTSLCEQISKSLPQGASVLLSAVPDPFFGLRLREDLDIREFVPAGIPISLALYQGVLNRQDYIISGILNPSPQVIEFLDDPMRCRVKRIIKDAKWPEYSTVIFEVRKHT